MFVQNKAGKKIAKTPDRQYVSAMQQQLLQKALAPWPRRNKPLLVVNCGDGIFLPMLWQSGFDLAATEYEEKARNLAMAKKISGLQIFPAQEDDLPFEEDYFDWAIIHLRNAEKINLIIKEALRVAKRGIMITFWNRSSLSLFWESFFWHSKKKDSLINGTVPFSNVWKSLKKQGAGRLVFFSALLTPMFAWNWQCPLAAINACFNKMPFGAWCIIRLDIANIHPITPLPIKFGSSMQNTAAAMEYAHKKLFLQPLKQRQGSRKRGCQNQPKNKAETKNENF